MRRISTLLTALVVSAAVAVPASASTSDALVGASTTAAASVNATASGHTGEGVGVALIDTGVSPQPGLGDRVAARVDVSGIGRNTDGLGHGTFLAGLVVGQEGPTGTHLGVAPDAHLVSVKVADAEGRTSLDRILAGLAAIKSAPAEMNIRVVVIAIGGPADGIADPLEEALEQLWAEGYVVVVASGNTPGVLTEPGTSPYLLTVGAADDKGTPEPGDDTVPVWSGAGEGRDGQPKPDVLAPGRSVVSVRVPGSLADRDNPASRIDGRWFRGSGTSQAAAVAAGAAAVLLEARPDLSPDEVKGRLVDGARPVEGSHAGVIDVLAALDSDAVANTHLPPLTPTAPETPVGEWQGKSWAGKSWAGKSWAGEGWVGKSWAGDIWVGKSWAGKSWAGKSWAGTQWVGKSWAEFAWIGGQWIGKSWADAGWIGKSWAGKSWAGTQWVGKSWAEFEWIGGQWIGKSWADAGWIGKSWADDQWDGKSWAGKSWAGKSWAGGAWFGKSWAGDGWVNVEWTGRSWA